MPSLHTNSLNNTFPDQLMDAINSGNLYDFCASAMHEADSQCAGLSDDDRALVQVAMDTCQQISLETQKFQSDLLQKLEKQGVKVSPKPSIHEGSGLQYHACEIYMEGNHLKRVLQILQQEGFFVDDSLLKNARIVQRCTRQLHFMKWDQVSLRLTLSWGQDDQRFLRTLLPNPKDLAFVALPQSLWPLYLCVKPIRAISEKVLHKLAPNRFSSGAHTKTASVNLGTPHILLPPMFELIGLNKDDTLIDLGCGDGRVMIAAAQQYRCKTVGVELNVLLAREAQYNVTNAGLSDHVTIHQGSIHDMVADRALNDVSVVFLFLPHRILSKTIEEIRAIVPPKTRILAHEQVFLPTDWLPTQRVPIITRNAITIASVWCQSVEY